MKIHVIVIIIVLCYAPYSLSAQNTTASEDSASIRHLKIEEVTVRSSLHRKNNSFQYKPMQAKGIVTLLGDPDIIRYIVTLPGISQGMEGGLGLFVRGGNSGNSRIELDGVPVYGSTHLMGFASSFHPDIIEQVDFKTGGLPSCSGDFLSSLTQLTTKPIDSPGIKFNFSISPFLVSAYLSEKKTKDSPLSFQVAARYSMLQPFGLLVASLIDELEATVNPLIADFYFKTNYEIDNRNNLYLSTYYSNDYLEFGSEDMIMTMNWANKIMNFRWERQIGNKTKLNTEYYYNNFHSGQRQQGLKKGELENELTVNTSLIEHNVKTALQSEFNHFNIKTGLEAKWQHFSPGNKKLIVSNNINDVSKNNYFPFSAILFSDLSYSGHNFQTTVGIRETFYQISEKNRFDTDFHLNFQFFITQSTGFEFNYDKLSQFRHVVEGLPTGWSLDLMIPAIEQFMPEKANQFYLGNFWKTENFSVSSGVYYKTMNHLMSYKNATDVFNTDHANWIDEVVSGIGRSYGLELHGEFDFKRTTNTVSYTLSKSDRRFTDINKDEWFPAKFDRRHILNLQSQFTIKDESDKKQHADISLSLTSGHNATIPVGMYEGALPPFWEVVGGGLYIPSEVKENAWYRQEMSGVNAYKMPSYFRIDVGYTFLKKRSCFDRELKLGVYNILNRKNPYLAFYKDSKWKQLSIIPIMPSIYYTIRFH